MLFCLWRSRSSIDFVMSASRLPPACLSAELEGINHRSSAFIHSILFTHLQFYISKDEVFVLMSLFLPVDDTGTLCISVRTFRILFISMSCLRFPCSLEVWKSSLDSPLSSTLARISSFTVQKYENLWERSPPLITPNSDMKAQCVPACGDWKFKTPSPCSVSRHFSQSYIILLVCAVGYSHTSLGFETPKFKAIRGMCFLLSIHKAKISCVLAREGVWLGRLLSASPPPRIFRAEL